MAVVSLLFGTWSYYLPGLFRNASGASESTLRTHVMNDEDLRYPVGRAQKVDSPTTEELHKWIGDLEAFPKRLEAAIAGLNPQQLDTPYRPGGWTVRQVVHRLADSHMNSYCRYRMALTEESPAILAYNEAAWAELPDAKTAPVAPSLAILAGVHERWSTLLKALTTDDWKRSFRHPERGLSRLDQATALYAWHGRHHLSHIQKLRERQNW